MQILLAQLDQLIRTIAVSYMKYVYTENCLPKRIIKHIYKSRKTPAHLTWHTE